MEPIMNDNDNLNSKIYKENINDNVNMIPGDPYGSPDESFKTLVFLDAGFLSKLSNYFGKGNYISYNIIKFAENLSKKQNLICEHIFYYTAPPFQSEKPIIEESNKYRKYEKFIKKISENKIISIREGRCQRLKINNKFIYKQKGVDTLMTIDLMSCPLKYPKIKKIILIASDSDFVPAVESLKEFGVMIILYTYYEKERTTNFSTSNELIKSVYKYVLLTKEDFYNAPLNKISGE